MLTLLKFKIKQMKQKWKKEYHSNSRGKSALSYIDISYGTLERLGCSSLNQKKTKKQKKIKIEHNYKHLGLPESTASHRPLRSSILAHQFVPLLLFPIAAHEVLKGRCSPSWGVGGNGTYRGMELRKGFWVLLLPQVCTRRWDPGLGWLLVPAGPCHRLSEGRDTAVRGCLKSSVFLFLFICCDWDTSSNVVSCQGKSPSFL